MNDKDTKTLKTPKIPTLPKVNPWLVFFAILVGFPCIVIMSPLLIVGLIFYKFFELLNDVNRRKKRNEIEIFNLKNKRNV